MKFNILFIFASVVFASYKVKVLETSILHFFPSLKLHHIIIIEDEKYRSIQAVDFTPINQQSLKTIGKLFLGFNVPAEIRFLPILQKELLDTKELIEKWEKSNWTSTKCENNNLLSFFSNWKNDSMNLYFH